MNNNYDCPFGNPDCGCNSRVQRSRWFKTFSVFLILCALAAFLFFFGFGVYRFIVPETHDGLTARQWEQYGREESNIVANMSLIRNLEDETLYACEHGDCPVAPRFKLIITTATTTSEANWMVGTTGLTQQQFRDLYDICQISVYCAGGYTGGEPCPPPLKPNPNGAYCKSSWANSAPPLAGCSE